MLIWLEVIEYCKAKEVVHLTFVTEDNKEGDWWRFYEGRYPLGPRVELQEELYTASKARLKLITSKRFFSLCQEFFKLDIDEAVQEIGELSAIHGRSEQAMAEVLGSPTKQETWIRHEDYGAMSKLCSFGMFSKASMLPPDQLRLEIERDYLPRIINYMGMKWRLHQLAKAYQKQDGVSDDVAIVRAHDVVRRCLFSFFRPPEVFGEVPQEGI